MVRNFKQVFSLILLFTFLTFTLFNCRKDDPEPTTGLVSGNVTALSNNTAIADATVTLFDATTKSPVSTTKTSSSGDYSFDAAGGTYYLTFNKQGFESVPPRGSEPITFSVEVGVTSTQSAQMSASSVSNGGYISGKISVGSTAKEGVLVVAVNGANAYSAVSDKDGLYTIFNVPAASYQVKGYTLNFSSTSATATVAANTETKDVNVTLTEGVTGTVSGTFKVISQTTIATPPTSMDISLVHPITKETIPGLSKSGAYSSSISFSFSLVPDGTYIVRATFANDYIVIDPDYVTKFGEYKVTVANGVQSPATLDIVATSAVILTEPTNVMTTTVPVEVTTTTPTFRWSAYPSTTDYVIEVTDATTGAIIWGGFTNTSGVITKNIVLSSSTTSVAYNSDSKAKASLASGKVYRWRVFASKNDVQQATGWKLISASEDQVGLIKIK